MFFIQYKSIWWFKYKKWWVSLKINLIIWFGVFQNQLNNYGGVWFVFLNNHFQFLNSISCSFIHFFTNMYFHKCFQTTIFSFKHTYQTDPMISNKYCAKQSWVLLGLNNSREMEKLHFVVMVFSGLKLWSRGVAMGLGRKGVLRLKNGLDVLFRCWESVESILKWFYFILYFLNLKFKSYFDQLKKIWLNCIW